jgi:hypothetical protein
VTDVLTRSASVPAIPWKDTPTLGHLAGRLVQEPPCFSLDGHAVTLAGPVDRLLLSDGSGWFGAVDLPPGEYLLTVEVPAPDVTIDLPVLVVAGTVAEGDILLPGCTPGWHLYLPLVLRQTNP